MKKNVIKKLAQASYTKNNLDKTKVGRVSKVLSRGDLRLYIKDLKRIEDKRTITVTIPAEEGASKIKHMFASIYPAKKIIIKVDPELISGIRVVDYDNEYELSLRSFLEEGLYSLKQND